MSNRNARRLYVELRPNWRTYLVGCLALVLAAMVLIGCAGPQRFANNSLSGSVSAPDDIAQARLVAANFAENYCIEAAANHGLQFERTIVMTEQRPGTRSVELCQFRSEVNPREVWSGDPNCFRFTNNTFLGPASDCNL